MNKFDLYLLFKAETGFYPDSINRGDYIAWLENKIYELTNEV